MRGAAERKIGSVRYRSHGDWWMPSDTDPAEWLS
jgi:hypothetical protein